LAAEEAGLFVSADTGLNWTHMWVDASDTTATNRRNVVHALHAYHDTLRVGTDSGLVTLYLDPSGAIDSSFNNVFLEDDSSSTVVVAVKVEEFYHPIDSTYDSLCIWTINYPLTDSGEYCIQRSIGDDDRTFLDQQHQVGVVTYDIDFMGDSVFVAGEYGVRFSREGENGLRNQTFTYDIVDNTKSPSDRIDEEVTVFQVLGDTILIGSKEGFAISYDRGDTYKITRVNQDTLAADAVLSYKSSLAGISGNFIPAVGLQELEGQPAAVWVSTRPTFSGSVGISVGVIDTLVLVDTSAVPYDTTYVRSFAKAYTDGFAWNFAFNGDSVFAATDGGLILNHQDIGTDWDTLEFISSTGRVVVDAGTPVYAVEVIGDDVWVGTDDGLVRMRPSGSSWVTGDVYRFVDSTTPPDIVYAYPVPWSRSLSAPTDDEIKFHFVVEEDAYITLEVYDFAMNLVSRVIDNRFFSATGGDDSDGHYHTGTFDNTWNGRNGAGEEVAVGMYHFKIEYSTGEVRWGKLAVIP
ncbi:MAG: hypothetical protein KAT79_04110, partial [candidate division Zixibacteria bacterium]|nr:hypothetical protein [candidate division Zixibacteria bacterium]